MGQAKRRAKEILELKKYEEYMRINFDCSKWFYDDGDIIGEVSIKNSNHFFSYGLEVLNFTSKDYYFGTTLNIYNTNENEELKLNNEVKNFFQNLFDKDDFLKELEKNLMKILPIKDFHNAIKDELYKYDYSKDEANRLEELYCEKPIEDPVTCNNCDGSGYHYLVKLEEYKNNPNIDLGDAIRCYKCCGDGVHEKGSLGYGTNEKKFVPYKE